MQCPACDIPLASETLAGQTVDRCGKCQGLWFDQEELGHVLRNPVVSSATSNHPPPNVVPAKSASELPCPVCHAKMNQSVYAHDSGICVSTCDACSGIWLRSGQVAQIVEYRACKPSISSLSDAIEADLQSAQKIGPLRRVIRSRWLSGIVVGGLLVAILNLPPMRFRGARLFGLLFFSAIYGLLSIWFAGQLAGTRVLRLPLFGTKMVPTLADCIRVAGWVVIFAVMAMTWYAFAR